MFPTQISIVVQDSLTDMINTYHNSSKEFQGAVDQMQENVSPVWHHVVTVYTAWQHLFTTLLHPGSFALLTQVTAYPHIKADEDNQGLLWFPLVEVLRREQLFWLEALQTRR